MNATHHIHFNAQVHVLRGHMILRLPEQESKKLPSRGQVAVTGMINGHDFKTVVEPDGYWGHFIKLSRDMQKQVGLEAGDTTAVTCEITKEWPEPAIPKDIAAALKNSPEKVKNKWKDITPMARWEWIRWVNATASDTTRAIRIEKTVSKLNGSHRRPCCFNLAACTDPELSKSGRLIQIT